MIQFDITTGLDEFRIYDQELLLYNTTHQVANISRF
jgi:hypothetical protein